MNLNTIIACILAILAFIVLLGAVAAGITFTWMFDWRLGVASLCSSAGFVLFLALTGLAKALNDDD